MQAHTHVTQMQLETRRMMLLVHTGHALQPNRQTDDIIPRTMHTPVSLGLT
jgi:hypothetical protein